MRPLLAVKRGRAATDVCSIVKASRAVVGACAMAGRSAKPESLGVEDMLCGRAALARRVAVAQRGQEKCFRLYLLSSCNPGSVEIDKSKTTGPARPGSGVFIETTVGRSRS